jgi:hypothetical protein
VIDFDKLSLHRPEAVYDLPTGGKRLVQRVDGYRHIIRAACRSSPMANTRAPSPANSSRG